MLSLITGKQRSGKSFYVMTLMIYYLRFTKRTICTNLPIYPDKICYYASMGIKGKNLVKYSEYLNRFHCFIDFRNYSPSVDDAPPVCTGVSRGDLKKFIKNSPDYWLKKKKGRKHPLMYYKDELLSFWNFTPANSVIFIDEVYQFFSSMDFKDISLRRRELLTYTRQHGHYKDDLFLISHNMADVDIHVRRGIQYKYEVTNMKYKNLIPPETKWFGPFFRGLKCPIQYFNIAGFEYGEDLPSDNFSVYPDNRIFKCYDSHSKAETLNKAMSQEDDDDGSDVGVNFWFNFKRFLIQFFPQLMIILSIGVGGFWAWSHYQKLIHMKPATISSKKEVEKPLAAEVEKKSEKPVPKIVMKMKDRIKYDDGVIIKKGGVYEVFTIVDIDSKYVTVEYKDASGKLEQSRVEIGGFRK